MLNSPAHNYENPEIDILTQAEKEKFKKFRLPLIPCQSCGDVATLGRNGQIKLNTPLTEKCVSDHCGRPLGFDDATKSYTKKDINYLETNVEDIEHQKIIALFRDNLLWFCSYCDTSNINIPKDAQGNADLSHPIGCAGCPNTYNKSEDITPFMPIRNIGYDDGDDSTDVYEMKKIAELHAIWMRALKKAIKIDNSQNNRRRIETVRLSNELGEYLSNYRKVGRGRRDGNKAIQFLEEYLYKKHRAVQKRVKRETVDTLHRGGDIIRRSRANDLPVHKQLIQWYKGLDKKYQALFASPLVLALAGTPGDFDIKIEGAYHQVNATKATKGTVDLDYHLKHKEPYVQSKKIYYKEVSDRTGQNKFAQYKESQRNYDEGIEGGESKKQLWKKGIVDYKLSIIGKPQWENKGSERLKVGTDWEYVSKTCFDDDSSGGFGGFSSGGSSSYGGGSSSGSGSSGMGTGSGGSLFFNEHDSIKLPNDKEIKNDGKNKVTPVIRRASNGIQDEVMSSLQITEVENLPQNKIKEVTMGVIERFLSATINDAMARECGSYEDVDKYDYANLEYLVQDYSVWNWKDYKKYTTGKIKGLDEESSIEQLKLELINDPYNQELQNIITKRFIKYLKSGAKDEYSEIKSRDELLWMSKNLKNKCTVHKNYLMYLIQGITEENLQEQCRI